MTNFEVWKWNHFFLKKWWKKLHVCSISWTVGRCQKKNPSKRLWQTHKWGTSPSWVSIYKSCNWTGVIGHSNDHVPIGLMHGNVISTKFTIKPRLRELFSTLCHLQAVFTWVFFSSLLLWEFVHDKIYMFTLRKRGLVVKLASLT